jgi:hypothetical protein
MANRRPSQFFRKGDPNINRRGRPAGQLPAKAIVWDLKMAARSYCKEALRFIVETMRDKNETRDTRLKAAGMLLERGYGRPLQEAVVDVNHAFVRAPDTMEVNTWLAQKGQPSADSAWLLAQRHKAEALGAPPTENRASEAPTGGTERPAEGEPLDLKAEAQLLDPDPTKPLPPGSRLN